MGLAVVSSSGQLRSMSGLVDLGIQVYCCEISDFKANLHLKSTKEVYCQAQAQVQVSGSLSGSLCLSLALSLALSGSLWLSLHNASSTST